MTEFHFVPDDIVRLVKYDDTNDQIQMLRKLRSAMTCDEQIQQLRVQIDQAQKNLWKARASLRKVLYLTHKKILDCV